MALVLTEEQSMLRDSARGLISDKAPVSHLRQLRDSKDATGIFVVTALGMAAAVNPSVAWVISVAFNLLMGRRWPPSESDLDDAEALCRALDLGPLLDRMPSGIQQMVGESGWRLSHGEQSRIFMARALLQGAEVVVLDESFAALDPERGTRATVCEVTLHDNGRPLTASEQAEPVGAELLRRLGGRLGQSM